ncbi:MAG: hypothetical protein QXT00_02735 [Ignisphaera sp.]
MFVLHGKGLVCGIKGALLPPVPLVENGSAFLPFPPIQTITVNLVAGIQPITQLGTYPVRDIVNLSLQQPAEVTVSCLLAEDYAFYPQLFSFFQKDVVNKHLPLVDMRVGLGSVYHDGRMPVIELRAGIARSLSIKIAERFATVDFSFTFPIGAYLPSAGAQHLPGFFVTSTDPARKVTTLCNITTVDGAPFLPFSRASVVSATITANLNTSLALTMPSILQAIFGSPVVPTSVYSIYNEGAPQYSGSLTLMLPPEVDIPPVFTLPENLVLSLVTEGGIVIQLLGCKPQAITPTLSHDSPIQFSLSLVGRGINITHL